MTEQELRDYADKKARKIFDGCVGEDDFFNQTLAIQVRCSDCSLHQETIKAKDAEIERLKSNFAGYENFQMEKQLKQELQKTREQLEKAESVIKFYADINNWTGEDINGWNCTNVIEPDDQETLETVWIKGCGTEKDIYDDCGGKRARQYFKDKQGE